MVYLNSVNWGLIEPPAGHDDDDPSEFWKWTRGTNGKVCVDSLHPPLKFQHLGRSPVCSTCVPNSRCLRARDMSSVISKLTKSLSNTAGSWQVRFSCSVVVTKGILNLPLDYIRVSITARACDLQIQPRLCSEAPPPVAPDCECETPLAANNFTLAMVKEQKLPGLANHSVVRA